MKENQKKQLKNLRSLQAMLAALLVVGGGLFAAVKISGTSSEQQQPVKSVNAAVQDTTAAAETETILEFFTEPVTEPPTEKEVDPLNPQFSVEAGFYQNPILLELSCPTSTAAIYYTTDSSTPTINSTMYTEPILLQNRTEEENKIASRSDTSVYPNPISTPVDKATVIRAVAIDADGTVSDIITHTYFIGLDQQQDYHNVNIVSVSMDESSLFDYYSGIYCTGHTYDYIGRGYDGYFIPCNYTQTGREWEREAGVEFFGTDGTSIASQEMGVRILGGTSRMNIQKSLKLYAREEYGTKRLQCDLFPGLLKEYDPTDDIKKFRTVVLRNGGDDYLGTKFRDAFIQRLVSDRAVSTQRSEPAIGFLNGEYMGVYNLQEDYSAYYMQSHYGVDKDDVIMVKTEEIEEGTNEDFQNYSEFSSFVNNSDLSDDAVYAEYCEKMDVQSLIDYFSIELWIENTDWINAGNNYRLWRSRSITNQPYQDGKWRWAVYDTEYSMGCDRDGEPSGYSSLLNSLISKRYYLGTNFFVQPLMQNESFKAQFVTSFMDICNSCFEPEHAKAVLDDMYQNEYQPLLNKGFRRTAPSWRWGTDEEMTAYTENVINEEKKFIEGRTEACITMLRDALSLGETAEVTVTINDTALGTVQIGTVTPEWDSPTWKGTYFTDYPITLTAIPKENAQFKGWSGAGISPADAKKETITVPVTKASRITAEFS